MILTVTLNPSVDYTMYVPRLHMHDANRVHRVEVDAGGKGLNVSRVAAQFDAPTLALGFSGGPSGNYVVSRMESEGVPTHFVRIQGETRSNFSVEESEVDAPPTTLNAKGPIIHAEEWEEFLYLYRANLANATWVVMAGSIPPGVATDAYAELTRLAHEVGRKVMVDADGEAMKLAMQAHPNLIKPNRDEAGRLLGRTLETLDEAVGAAHEILNQMEDHGSVILSLGRDGAILACEEGAWLVESPPIEPKSTVGSGDSMVAGYLSSILRGDTPDVALRWGAAAGAATATTDGTQLARRSVIELLYRDVHVHRLR